MAIHKVEVEWHDLIENPNDIPMTDDIVFVTVENTTLSYTRVDTENFRCVNGAWERAILPTDDDPDPDEYVLVSEAWPHLKIIAWCKPLLPYLK